MQNFWHPTNWLGRILLAVFYGFCVFLVIFILGMIVSKFATTADIGAFLEKWASLIGLLAGAVALFTGYKPVGPAV